jgi:hypothetical protein
MPALTARRAALARDIGYAVGLLGVAILAIALHRNGHTQGDDFALYLRQARSIFEGNPGQVIADNRFAVLNSDSGFSPIGYPWGWPLVLSPFVHLWGLDYDRLKLVTVALFCIWLALLFGIVRRRLGRWPALGVVAIIGTSPQYLLHTDQLLSEYLFFISIAVVIWWCDRIQRDNDVIEAGRNQLIVLGVLMGLAFNVRREAMVLVVVVAALQVVALVSANVDGRRSVRGILERARRSWVALLTPYASFVASIVVFQLLLPTALLPDNGNSRAYLRDRLGEFPATLTNHLNLGKHPVVGIAILAVAVVGAVLGVRRRPKLDAPLVALALFTSLILGTHLRQVERYWLQVTPWVLYFAVVALVELSMVFARHRRVAGAVVAIPFVVLVAAHLSVLPGRIADARDLNDAGSRQFGPSNPVVDPVYEAVLEFTPADSVVAFYRARTMTLLTDRRSFQTKDLDRILQSADYYAERRNSKYWQPTLDEDHQGLVEVWSDPRWTLWQVAET